MAGVTINRIQKIINSKNIIRIMPNVMAKQNASHTYVYVKNKKLINTTFNKILKSFGTFHIASKEDEINIATALYGSGPAFIAFLVNAFVAASKNISPNSKLNERDVIHLFQNVISINDSSQKLEKFVQSIASKKGTTQAGVHFLKSQNLKKLCTLLFIGLINVLRKLALKNKALNKSNLKDLNNVAHLGNFPKKLKTFNSNYENFESFLEDFEKYLENQIEVPSSKLNSQDKIFEGIVNRLDVLSDFKKIVIRIYLESQQNPKLLITLNKYIHKYFSSF